MCVRDTATCLRHVSGRAIYSRRPFIKFGEPPVGRALDLGLRRVIRPRAGKIVLFPSCFWHGTIPFEDETPRLTVAFDAVPEVG
ncbi:MAG: hypothetical protein DIU71_13085 [Proteobacteria bacterium]|nr:MAG: hypothetical protein DIU71_13085 [Pseudomonadota bacterium]